MTWRSFIHCERKIVEENFFKGKFVQVYNQSVAVVVVVAAAVVVVAAAVVVVAAVVALDLLQSISWI